MAAPDKPTEKVFGFMSDIIIARCFVPLTKVSICVGIFDCCNPFSFVFKCLQSCRGEKDGRQCLLQGERLQKSVGLLHASHRALPRKRSLLRQSGSMSHDDGTLSGRPGRRP